MTASLQLGPLATQTLLDAGALTLIDAVLSSGRPRRSRRNRRR
ncbi:hypothetical protein [Amycolatopsis jiangsuensis]|uniref:Uncharacterized protein n=1 Tax=Amycolatopsis jiangsuensis TaxID=1181879 RepID=A0A840J271_9PSEU|nr:hypothetical protein [Amycolatopsis jiangsuensis]MBB4688140.1 hypothetical protein [Amycolatopsis jiangsuensis]